MTQWGELAHLPNDTALEILKKEIRQFYYYRICRECEEWKFTNKYKDCENCEAGLP